MSVLSGRFCALRVSRLFTAAVNRCATQDQVQHRGGCPPTRTGEAPVSPPVHLRHYWSRCCYGVDSEREPIDPAHDDAFSGGNGDRGDGVPKLAVDKNFSGRRERGLRNSDFANHSLFAGDNLVAAGAHGDAHEKGRNKSERDADGERGQGVDAHFGDGRVD